MSHNVPFSMSKNVEILALFHVKKRQIKAKIRAIRNGCAKRPGPCEAGLPLFPAPAKITIDKGM